MTASDLSIFSEWGHKTRRIIPHLGYRDPTQAYYASTPDARRPTAVTPAAFLFWLIRLGGTDHGKSPNTVSGSIGTARSIAAGLQDDRMAAVSGVTRRLTPEQSLSMQVIFRMGLCRLHGR
jgi:hypothetical protein